MNVKDILSVLPMYSDNSGYDVTFVKADGKLRKMYWSKIDTYNMEPDEELCDDLLNAEVLSIEAGRVRPGGHFNSELHVYVEYRQASSNDESEGRNGA